MREWFYQIMGEVRGPFDADEMRRGVGQGLIETDTLVRRKNSDWVLASSIRWLLGGDDDIAFRPPPPPAEDGVSDGDILDLLDGKQVDLPRPKQRTSKSARDADAESSERDSIVPELAGKTGGSDRQPDELLPHFQMAMQVLMERQETSIKLLTSIADIGRQIERHCARMVWAFITVPAILVLLYFAWMLLTIAFEP